MAVEINKQYSPKEIESKWYSIWEDNNCFKPKEGKKKESYCIIMPPPNITGKLHIGHALNFTIQDTLIRHKRMQGYETLWIPGTDHAGIATQSVVEKIVQEKEGKIRLEYDREDFIKKIWQWKEKYNEIITNQLKKIGVSSDWNYYKFTMDDDANEAVKSVFVRLYNEGFIYQADYIVNWDTKLKSAISDIEVEYKELQGNFYHIKYFIKENNDQYLEVATTRPETLLGDTAVAVHPADERFNKLIGKTAIVPICNREVPIIADEYVDIEKGTGCLKVTPGHDFNDFNIGKRHNLPIMNIINEDGSLNDYGLQFKGINIQESRKPLVEELKKNNLLIAVNPHTHQVGHGERSKSIIEPMVSKQWFLKTEDMSRMAINAVETNKTKIIPKNWENNFYSWLREPRDWCISRQLWWGHRIPIFYCNSCNYQWASTYIETECPKCHSKKVKQDPDVLDTWFSSALWPMSTLGWPDKKTMEKKGMHKFFPTTSLITGFDIIFFWVARMMMMSLKFAKKIPFKDIYLHAIIRDKFGRKMSKSLGNGIDPIDVINEYGADALRLILISNSGYNRTINIDIEKIKDHRNFINKIWNAFRFLYPYLDNSDKELKNIRLLTQDERWIISELNHTIKEVNNSINIYRFDDACLAIYNFVYDKFCSWFIELSKQILQGSELIKKNQRATILKFTLKKIMALLHPFIPHVTEEIWKHIKDSDDELLIIHDFPEYNEQFEFVEEQELMNNLIEIITTIRNLRAIVGVKPKHNVNVEIFSKEQYIKSFLNSRKDDLLTQGKLKNVFIRDILEDRPKKSIMKPTKNTEIFLLIDENINIEEKINHLNNDRIKLLKEFEKYDKKLLNEKFIKNAKPTVIEEVKQKHLEIKNKLLSIDNNLDMLKS